MKVFYLLKDVICFAFTLILLQHIINVPLLIEIGKKIKRMGQSAGCLTFWPFCQIIKLKSGPLLPGVHPDVFKQDDSIIIISAWWEETGVLFLGEHHFSLSSYNDLPFCLSLKEQA